MTPRWRLSGVRVAIRLYAPRNLKAPPRWNCSHLSHTDWPALASKLPPVITGVRWPIPASLLAALSISSNVVGNVVLVCTGSLAMGLLPLLSLFRNYTTQRNILRRGRSKTNPVRLGYRSALLHVILDGETGRRHTLPGFLNCRRGKLAHGLAGEEAS
jgi:hypothetical protein